MPEGHGKAGLQEIYGAIGWPTDPEDPTAIERFRGIERVMRSLLDKGAFNHVLGKRQARILDVMAASGICGVALARVLASRGVKVSLTITDLRKEELDKAPRWLEKAGISIEVELNVGVADAIALPRFLEEGGFDIATVWGSSLPHLDSYELMLLLAGLRELQGKEGVLLVEQASILPRILVSNYFRYVLVEGEALTIFREYDDFRGMQRRLAYKLPGLEYIGVVESRLWEASQITAAVWMFYRDVEVYELISSMPIRRTKIIVASKPREKAPSWEELYSVRPRPAGLLEPSP